MIEHDSDYWPERYWAIQLPQPWQQGRPTRAYPFPSKAERDEWVSRGDTRKVVGARHPAVKTLRQEWRREALKRLAARKER